MHAQQSNRSFLVGEWRIVHTQPRFGNDGSYNTWVIGLQRGTSQSVVMLSVVFSLVECALIHGFEGLSALMSPLGG